MFIKYDSNITLRNLNGRHLGVYKVYSTVDINGAKSNTNISATIYIQKLHKDDYIILTATENTEKHYTAVELEAAIRKSMDNVFKDNPYPDVNIDYVAKTSAEYLSTIKSIDDDFDDLINSLADRIYVISGNNHRKNINLPILFIKRNGEYYVINRTKSNWNEEAYTAKSLIAMANLMFAKCFTLKQIKI